MRAARALAAALLILGAIGPPAVQPTERLIAGKALSAKTHTTDFQGAASRLTGRG
jgi:hypothetical protein